ncbi:DUF2721 domain-containing protein [Sphingomicrobium clamense]|uniref:DUF2721 domain-containing protein n=1 Tax=Sphingomicrobium clamense TaxID=2851013 RepID=A0ABS6V2K9_9SPHN|nr:DUF2721 domain-containing protein [Sphingomicrobium sp. B8]MBW0143790.1 DUF2721 domain-containing protein [Sphingomicrobium sp. B8]
MTEPTLSGIATDLLTRTASTARVQGIVQLSLAPVFLLAAIGAILNVMNARLIWIVDRVERLERREEGGHVSREVDELPALHRRQHYAQVAINLATAAALTICVVVALLFISAFIRPAIGTVVAILWISSMALVFGSLFYFLRETQLATSTIRERRKLAEKIREQEASAED